MKKVLCVAFDFPPRRTSGIYRATGITKYLSQYGWSPSVLTVEKLDGQLEDPRLLLRVPTTTKVFRTRFLDVAGWEASAFRAIQSVGGLQSNPTDILESKSDRTLRSMGALLRSILYFPDDTVGWVPFGLEGAVASHLRDRFDVIYTTSPPRSTPIIGLLFKWLFRIPWVSEHRDPWRPHPFQFRQKAEQLYFGATVKGADRVVFHSKGFAEEVVRQFGLPEEKTAQVSNGFDEPDFAVSMHNSGGPFPPGYVHLSHFGTIYPKRSGKFFDALAELIRESPDLKQRLRVNIVGFPDDEAQRFAGTQELREVLQFFPFMKHDEAIEGMRTSHGLVLFWGDPFTARLTVAGKIYEYLRCGRPILAVSHPGETTEMIEAAKAGWSVNPEDTASIKRIIRELVAKAQPLTQTGPPCPDYVAQFRYDRLAARLAKVFDEVTANGR